MAVERLLCHVCCGQCWLGALDGLAREAKVVEGFFYNPNIQPLLEWRRRLKAVRVLAEQMKLTVHFEDAYGMQEWLQRVVNHERERCRICREMRLRKTAEFAKERGFDAFTTTLLVSKHQDHEDVRRAGEEVAKEVGVPFLYRDMREFAEKGHEEAKRRSLYLQQYCGCVYSEYERFKDTRKYL
jgi:hypothetical protein